MSKLIQTGKHSIFRREPNHEIVMFQLRASLTIFLQYTLKNIKKKQNKQTTNQWFISNNGNIFMTCNSNVEANAFVILLIQILTCKTQMFVQIKVEISFVNGEKKRKKLSASVNWQL